MSRVLSARARARAPGPRVALGPPALLTIGDYDQRLFARAQLSKNLLVFWAILSRGSFFYFCVNFILFCLNCVQMFYNLFNFSRVFNLTLCVSAGKITQSWKKTRARARARHFFNFFLLSFESLLSRQLRFHDLVFFSSFSVSECVPRPLEWRCVNAQNCVKTCNYLIVKVIST